MSGQNTSHAVMQQRSEARDSLDDFPTPPWAGRALCEWIVGQYEDAVASCEMADMIVREPAVNRGYLARALSENFGAVEGADVHDYGCGWEVADYLFGPRPDPVDWTITNPPFRLAEQFIARALPTSDVGVAMLVRSAFLEGAGRWRDLFSVTPPTDILQFVERVPMVKGRYDPKASTATAYVWLVWIKGEAPLWPNFHWIAPCRMRLQRPEDVAGLPGPLIAEVA